MPGTARRVPGHALHFALAALISARTHALKVIHPIDARAAVSTRSRLALVYVRAAVLARESRPTLTPIVVLQTHATAAVCTRLRQTNVHLGLTVPSDIAGHALTPEIVHQIDARAPVLAQPVRPAVVHVRLALGARKSGGTLALEPAPAQRNTLAAVRARTRLAVVHLRLTVSPTVAGRTGAPKTRLT